MAYCNSEGLESFRILDTFENSVLHSLGVAYGQVDDVKLAKDLNEAYRDITVREGASPFRYAVQVLVFNYETQQEEWRN